MENIQKESAQNREEARVAYEVPLQLSMIYIGKSGETYPLKKTVGIRSLDLSAKGIKIFSTYDFPEEVGFCLDIPIDGNTIQIVAEIVRKKPGDGGFYYGCQFIGVEGKDRDLIRQYVFRHQIRQTKQA